MQVADDNLFENLVDNNIKVNDLTQVLAERVHEGEETFSNKLRLIFTDSANLEMNQLLKQQEGLLVNDLIISQLADRKEKTDTVNAMLRMQITQFSFFQFAKDIINMREQVFQKNRLLEAYVAEDNGTYDPEQYITGLFEKYEEELLVGDNLETIMRKVKRILAKMKKDQADKQNKQDLKIKNMVDDNKKQVQKLESTIRMKEWELAQLKQIGVDNDMQTLKGKRQDKNEHERELKKTEAIYEGDKGNLISQLMQKDKVIQEKEEEIRKLKKFIEGKEKFGIKLSGRGNDRER
ncbi:MAG: hypothetical protein EZS28_043271, partial [Streblomastix strix]